LFTRFKYFIRNEPQILNLVEDLGVWFEKWSAAVSSPIPTFKDPITSSLPSVRALTLDQIRKDIDRLITIVRRESGVANRLRRQLQQSTVTPAQAHQALVSRLNQAYDPPGALREGHVARHDNDFADISAIRVAPTHDELLCPILPHLPYFIENAPHHLPEYSMERHLDIQFRLLREELMYVAVIFIPFDADFH